MGSSISWMPLSRSMSEWERSKRFGNSRVDRMLMHQKWQLCVVLFVATTLNYLDRQTMSILAPALQKELHLGNEALGWLFAIFYYAYTFSQMAVGTILDCSYLRWAFASAVFLWSVVSILTVLANGFVALL